MPDDIAELNMSENSLTDVWGRRFEYKRTANHFEIKSLGKDGKIGGSNENKDLVIVYRTHSDSGEVLIDDENWLPMFEIRTTGDLESL